MKKKRKTARKPDCCQSLSDSSDVDRVSSSLVHKAAAKPATCAHLLDSVNVNALQVLLILVSRVFKIEGFAVQSC